MLESTSIVHCIITAYPTGVCKPQHRMSAAFCQISSTVVGFMKYTHSVLILYVHFSDCICSVSSADVCVYERHAFI